MGGCQAAALPLDAPLVTVIRECNSMELEVVCGKLSALRICTSENYAQQVHCQVV